MADDTTTVERLHAELRLLREQQSADQAEIARLVGERAALADDVARYQVELSEAVEQQAATAEILRAITASNGDVQSVLQVVAEQATQVCAAVDAQVGRVLRGILGADEQALRESFDASATGSTQRWTIRLAPRAREMARVLREIRLGGGRHLETIEVEETAGNLTTIRMRQFSVAERLEPAELEFFKAP